ncbi:MAG: glycosyltransferase family 25 protein [Burkholderiaceae bacterium]
MQIFIINLARRPDKRDAILKRIAATGLEAQIVEAVDGAAMSDAVTAGVARDWPASCMTKGVIACALSHLKIYQKIVEENIPLALVLEDDALPTRNLAGILEDIADADDGNTPKVYLLSSHHFHPRSSWKLRDGHALHDFIAGSQGHAYVINRKAAAALHENLRPVVWEADKWWYFQALGYVKVECVVPHVVGVDGVAEKSDLQPERGALHKRRRAYLRKLATLAPLRAHLQKFAWRLFRRPFARKS